MGTFTVGGESGDHIMVRTFFSDEEDWVAATISLRMGSFEAEFGASLTTFDFPAFRKALEDLYRSLDGTASFRTLEEQIELDCIGNGRGGIAVKGVAMDRVGDGNELRFHFDIDQTFLPAIIADLRMIEAAFPNAHHSSEG